MNFSPTIEGYKAFVHTEDVPSNIDRLLDLAKDEIDSLISHKELITESTKDDYLKAIYSQVEYYTLNGSNISQTQSNVTSISIGKFSQSFSQNNSLQGNNIALSPLALRYLNNSYLLYKGVQ